MLKKQNRLTKSQDFKRVFSTGKTYIHRWIILKVLTTSDKQPGRFGFTTSARLGNSVVRNRIKRLLRESVRLLEDSLKHSGYDAILIARPGIKEKSFSDVSKIVTEVLEKAGLLEPSDTMSGRISE